MAGNTIGKLFSLTTFGESHGEAIGAIVDGCPPGMPLSVDDLQPDLDRRKPGTSRFTTQRREKDIIKILSGIFNGKTTGTPIGLLIQNTDQRSQNYNNLENVFRPSHADYSYLHKYGIRDHRGGGRSSARETAMRVAAGSIAKKYLSQYGIEIIGYLSQLGDIKVKNVNFQEIHKNPFFCPDETLISAMKKLITEIRKEGDSIGARITVIANGIPPGLGEPVFDRLDADIAKALMSINAVKGVEIGAGFTSVTQKGSEHRDEITAEKFLSNNAGGILGGISSGQQIIANLAIKPAASIMVPGRSIDIHGNNTIVQTKGRHDPCVGIRATPIAEAMLAITIMDHWLRHRGQNHNIKITTPMIADK